MTEKTEVVPFPATDDHLQYQKSMRAKKTRHQNLKSAGDVVNYLVLRVQSKYRKGHRNKIEAKIGFELSQIDGLTVPDDGLVHEPGYREKLQRQRLEEVFRPLIDQAFDADQLIGSVTIEPHGKGCTLRAYYEVRTPKQFRQ